MFRVGLFLLIFIAGISQQAKANEAFSGIEVINELTRTAPVTEVTAYIHRSQVRLADNRVTVTNPHSNLRLGPSTRYNIVNVAKRGDVFEIVTQVDGWYKIKIPDTYARNVSTRMRLGVVRATGGLNFRQSPGGRLIRTLRDGSRVEIVGESGEWYRVNYNGQSGYVFKRYIYEQNGDYVGIEEERMVPTPEPEQSEPATRGVRRTPGGGVELTGVPLYAQRGVDPFDPNRGSGQYPGAYCGPTSLQMVLAYHGIQKSRDYLGLTNVGEGPMYRRGQGSAYGPMVRMAKHLGMGRTEIIWRASVNSIKQALIAGRPQIVSVAGTLRYKDGGSYSTNGHIMVVTGVDDNGDLIIQDPALRTNGRRTMRASEFRRIWRGFSVDIKR